MNSFRTIELSDHRFVSNGLHFMTVKTNNLKGRGDVCLFIPTVDEEVTDLPIYVLLHGVYGSAWAWALKGGVHLTVQRLIDDGLMKPAIIAMPSDGLWGDGSAYFSHHGKYFDQWVVHDVPLAIKENFPAAGTKSSLCIGGLSMGGYGALMLGARFPDRFQAISAHSSITRLQQMIQFVEEPLKDYSSFCNIADVIEAMWINKDHLPAVRFDCGVADPLIEPNRLLHRQLSNLNIDHHYEEFPGGHEWPYWQEHVVQSILFFDQHT